MFKKNQMCGKDGHEPYQEHHIVQKENKAETLVRRSRRLAHICREKTGQAWKGERWSKLERGALKQSN